MRILHLGSGGRLGSAVERLIPHHTYLSPSVQELDITNQDLVNQFFDEHADEIDLVLNCAAYNNVDGAEGEGRALAEAINAVGPGYLAAAAARHKKPIVQIGTDYVFRGDKVDGYTEIDETDPISVYGATKAGGEANVIANTPQHYIVRTSRLYGAPARDEGSKRSFVEIVLELARNNDRFTMNPKEVSAPTWVDDLARHLEEHIIDPLPEPGIYHMANSGGCTWLEWAEEIIAAADLSAEVMPRDLKKEPDTRPAMRPAYSVLLSTKIPPMRSWQEALREYLKTL